MRAGARRPLRKCRQKGDILKSISAIAHVTVACTCLSRCTNSFIFVKTVRAGFCLALALIFLSPDRAYADRLQLHATGTSFFDDFTIIFEDTGDGLLQHQEIITFSGVTGTVPDSGMDLDYTGVAFIPDIPGAATESGTINPNFPCSACWEFTPSQFGDVSDGWFATRWTYTVNPAPDMRIEFTGSIDHIQVFDSSGLSFPATLWGVSVGDPVAGEMTYDSSALPISTTADSASYRPNASYHLQSTAITIDGSGTDSFFVVHNDSFSGSVSALVDDLNFSLDDVTFSGSVAVPAGYDLDFGGIQFRTQDLSFLQSTDLPRVEPGQTETHVDPDLNDLFQVAFFARFDFRSTSGDIATFVALLSPVSFSSTASVFTVPADDCTSTAGGCNPTGGHQIVLPDGFVVPPGSTIAQEAIHFVDPRSDANGRCDGVTPLVLFDGDLIIPPHICGSPEFEVLITDANFNILEGTILHTMFPAVFVSNPLECTRPIIGDPQLQDIVVWQPTDSADVIEGHAVDVTYDCGSSRGRTRDFSYFIVGTHIDFGVDFDQNPEAVVQAFIDLTSTKYDSLLAAVIDARPALKLRDFVRLFVTSAISRKLHMRGRFHAASRTLEAFIRFTNRAQFDTSVGFNHGGELLTRGENIKFILDEKIIPFEH